MCSLTASSLSLCHRNAILKKDRLNECLVKLKLNVSLETMLRNRNIIYMKLIINFLANSSETVVTQDWTYCACVDYFITGCAVEVVSGFLSSSRIFIHRSSSFIPRTSSLSSLSSWISPNHTASTNFNLLNSWDKAAYKVLRAFSNRWTIRTASTSDFGWFMSSLFCNSSLIATE